MAKNKMDFTGCDGKFYVSYRISALCYHEMFVYKFNVEDGNIVLEGAFGHLVDLKRFKYTINFNNILAKENKVEYNIIKSGKEISEETYQQIMEKRLGRYSDYVYTNHMDKGVD